MRKQILYRLVASLSAVLVFSIAVNRSDTSNISIPKTPVPKSNVKLSEPSPVKMPPLRPSQGCGPVPVSLRSPPYNLDKFYQQYCDADGIPILASSHVDPEALRIAKRRVEVMTRKLAGDVKWAMIDAQTRLAIVGKNEVLTDIPEKSELNKLFPHRNWDSGRIRGVGPSKKRPVAVTGEENVLCLKGNNLPGSDTFVHEFAHTIHRMGLSTADPNFEVDLKSAYHDAVKKRGLWKDAYASTNYAEYWAMGVQIWFDVNYTERSAHKNYIKTKAQLVYYDPKLYNLIAKYMHAGSIEMCPV